MPKLREIVDTINSSMKTGNFNGRTFQSGVWYGIAYQLEKDEKAGESEDYTTVKRPAVVDNYGEGVDVSYDDTYPITFYHRIVSPLQYPEGKDNYGNPNSSSTEIADLVLVCIADRSKVNTTTEDLCAAIVCDIPRELSQTSLTTFGLNFGAIEIIETNTDPLSVFSQEFSNVAFSLTPEITMLAVRYRITTQFGKECFSLCN